jgi:phosphatidylethanolamine/phosphatidyl-N-methylethanolamine N-methyltransferase
MILSREAFKNMKQTGSIIESSPFLIRKMLHKIDFTSDIHVVELGAGNGCVTKSLLRKLNQKSRLTSFEINPALFKKVLRINDGRLTCINDDVANLLQYLQLESIDYIVSALPLANIHRQSKDHILDSCYKALKPNGRYTQFQYSTADLGLIKKKFPKFNFSFTLLNIPPALVYYATK